MVSALLLKDRFEHIVLLERQSRERFLRSRGFTFPIVFSPAAIRVLDRIGVWDAIRGERSPFFGVVIHKRMLGRDLTWTAKRDDVYSHWRNHIVTSLYDRVCADGIEVHFEAQVEDIDFSANMCREATLGELPFDLLLGADGMYSSTRGLMAIAHPAFPSEEFRSTLLDRWYAYRVPAEEAVAKRYGTGERGFASHVYADNPADFPAEKLRVITTAMTQPRAEISVLLKHGVDTPLERVHVINAATFGDLVDADVLDAAWDEGHAGAYEHIQVPTFRLESALLVGDAAHGFEGTGDLINVGISSVGGLPEILDAHDEVTDALAAYDDTVGRSLRAYSAYALRRSLEQIDFEVAAFEIGALLRLNRHHPSLWGIFEDDFDICDYMRRYERDRRRIRAGTAALSASAAVLSMGAAVVGLGRRKVTPT
jgi:2-polyprenyl-6-methoxyphenol hydroxylase-like FAD-dependent oxidoreductase